MAHQESAGVVASLAKPVPLVYRVLVTEASAVTPVLMRLTPSSNPATLTCHRSPWLPRKVRRVSLVSAVCEVLPVDTATRVALASPDEAASPVTEAQPASKAKKVALATPVVEATAVRSARTVTVDHEVQLEKPDEWERRASGVNPEALDDPAVEVHLVRLVRTVLLAKAELLAKTELPVSRALSALQVSPVYKV